jgi:predicted nucleic acid-binding protein
VIVLDTSGLLAAIDRSQRMHSSCAGVLAAQPGPYLLSPFVLGELDYLLGTRVGLAAQDALLQEVERGAYRLEPFLAADVAAARRTLAKYSSLHIGIADASLVVLADRHGTRDILTLDERHFRALRNEKNKPFRLLPADGPKRR